MPMPVIIRVFRGLAASALLVVLLVQPALSQLPKEPEREELLNGLRVLVWSQPGSPELLVKLRINSGAAFDLAGKRRVRVGPLRPGARRLHDHPLRGIAGPREHCAIADGIAIACDFRQLAVDGRAYDFAKRLAVHASRAAVEYSERARRSVRVPVIRDDVASAHRLGPTS